MPAVDRVSLPAKALKKNHTSLQQPKSDFKGRGRISLKGNFTLLCVLLLSGTAGLIYQVIWIRQLSLVVGVEVYSITIAVSAFFAGLAAGGWFFGRLADRFERPLLLYSLLEAGVAVAGVAATLALGNAAELFVAIQARAGVLAWIVPILLVGAPAFLMGGTLPAAVRCQAQGETQIAQAGGWVYAANTAGGILGAVLSSFALLPWLGVRGSAVAAALLNLAAAGLAFVVTKAKASEVTTITAETAEDVGSSREGSRTAMTLYAVAGGVALGYEVVWSQALAQFMSTRVFAFSVVLATYLAGLVAGSALYVRFGNRVRDAWGVFGLLISAAGVVALGEMAWLSLWQLRVQIAVGNMAFAVGHSDLLRMCAQFAVAALGIVFLPTVLLGAAFPIVLRLAAGTARMGRDVGVVLALNTAGGIVGSLLTGFLLIPALGLVRTLGLLAVTASTIGAIAVLQGTQDRLRVLVYCLGVIAAVAAIATPPDSLAKLLLATRGGGNLTFYEEGRGATVAIAEQRSGDNVFRRLYIQGTSNSGDALPSMRYMRLQAMLPLIIHHSEPKSALVIGFGTGITAGAVLHYPRLERRVCAELLPAVVRSGKFFPENYGAGTDARMQIRIGDGRQELLRHSEQYDLITLEPPPPSAEGIVNLYSTDFYRLASKRLAPNGLFAQWLPIATQNDSDTRSLVRSFLDVFPYATLWTTEMHEMLLVGSNSPVDLDVKTISARFEQPDVRTALQAVGVASPAALLATWVTDRDGLERYASDAGAVTDDRPRIEYATWVRPREITRVLSQLLALRTEPKLRGADDALLQEIAARHQSLMKFYTAGLDAYKGDRQSWTRDIAAALQGEPDNPYFRWAAGN